MRTLATSLPRSSGFGNSGLTATAAQMPRQTEDASKKKIYCYHAFAGVFCVYFEPFVNQKILLFFSLKPNSSGQFIKLYRGIVGFSNVLL